MRLPTPEQLAATFIQTLRAHLGAERFAEVCRRNAAEPDPRVCHSHDFCDANIVMAEALDALAPNTNTDDDAAVALWNDAWSRAFKVMQRLYASAPAVVICLRCPLCGFTLTPLADLTPWSHADDLFCGSVICASCDQAFAVEHDAVRAAQHALLVALREA